jgi:FAD synthetase
MASSFPQGNKKTVTKIITPEALIFDRQKKIVLVGGCFDILHDGHFEFLKKAKAEGDILVVLLENDENVKKRKGPARPINTQNKRAKALADLSYVDFVIRLKEMTKDAEYDKLIVQIKPDVLAITKGDPGIKHRQRQAKLTGARVAEVIERIGGLSTTSLLDRNGQNS